MRTGKIQPIQKPLKFLFADHDHFFGTPGPLEPVLLQSFVPEAKAVFIPVKNLDHVTFPIAEHKQVAGKGILAKMLLHHDRQSIDGFAHVRAADSQVHQCIAQRQHHSPRTAATN